MESVLDSYSTKRVIRQIAPLHHLSQGYFVGTPRLMRPPVKASRGLRILGLSSNAASMIWRRSYSLTIGSNSAMRRVMSALILTASRLIVFLLRIRADVLRRAVTRPHPTAGGRA